MKNLMTITVIGVLFSLFALTDAAAQCCGRGGSGMNQGAAVSPETMEKFNKKTRGLQEKLIDKQTLLKKEWLKDDPNPETVATIRKAIIDIQVEMQKIAKELGIHNGNGSCHAFRGNGCGGGRMCH